MVKEVPGEEYGSKVTSKGGLSCPHAGTRIRRSGIESTRRDMLVLATNMILRMVDLLQRRGFALSLDQRELEEKEPIW
jgi:hypothetical protein